MGCGDGALVRTFKGHSDRISSVAFSPNDAQVLSGSWDNTIKLWDAATGELVAFSPNSTRVLSGSYDGTIKL